MQLARVTTASCLGGSRPFIGPDDERGGPIDMKLIHITDTHFVARGLKLYGLDPHARLAAAVADINAFRRDAKLAIVTDPLGRARGLSAFRFACPSSLSPTLRNWIIRTNSLNHSIRTFCARHLS